MSKIGIVFGCFIPLHRGHMAVIQKALNDNDHVIVAVTGHDQDRGRDFIPFLRRVRLMQQIYKDCKSITIVEVDDKKLGLTGTFSETAWKKWCAELFANAMANPWLPGTTYTWYTGEQSYVDKIENLYPEHTFVLCNRDMIPISGTAIRQEPGAHRDAIHPVFLRYLETMYLM